jgi:hypothetical protein
LILVVPLDAWCYIFWILKLIEHRETRDGAGYESSVCYASLPCVAYDGVSCDRARGRRRRRPPDGNGRWSVAMATDSASGPKGARVDWWKQRRWMTIRAEVERNAYQLLRGRIHVRYNVREITLGNTQGSKSRPVVTRSRVIRCQTDNRTSSQ